MRRFLLFSSLIFLLFQPLIFAQRDSLRTLFLDAESWFLFEEYSEALPLYQELLEKDPGNDNLNYKIGICLLHDPYQKDKSIQYLLKASNNINPSYKENSQKERTAPPDALYYLGNAYLVNELFNRAIESYEEFLRVMDPEVYDVQLVQDQIRSCHNAQRLKNTPVDIELTLLDETINTRYADIRPVISGDGTRMAFVTELPFYDGAFFTEKTDQGWSYPRLITQSLGFDADIYPVCLSWDGTEMILYYDDDYIGNLYYSRYENGRWLPAQIMGDNITTKYWESDACFSSDGESLYFTSNRKGTYGGLDIFVSYRLADGSWGPPANLGTTINTPYNEESPYLSEDGKTLYFSSYGHYNMGGYDIFYARKDEDGAWGTPVNLGYPINTTDNDLHFQPFNEGHEAYYSVYSPKGIGRHDIYHLQIYSADYPRFYSVSGILHTRDGRMDSTQMAVDVVDTDTGDTLIHTRPGQDGSFGFRLKQGSYVLHFTGQGYREGIRPLLITSESDKEGIELADILLEDIPSPELIEQAEAFGSDENLIQLRDTEYEGVAGEVLSVPIRAPRGSTLMVRTYQGSRLVDARTVEQDRRRINLDIVPLPGTIVVEIEMFDEAGNKHTNRFTVLGLPQEGRGLEEEGAGEGVVVGPDERDVDLAANMRLLELAGLVAGGDANLLKEELSDNAQGPLKDYVQTLDLHEEGIQSTEEFVLHLGEASEPEGFTMDEVSRAMLLSLGGTGEVQDVGSLLSQLRLEAGGTLKEVLDQLDLELAGITSPRALFEYLYRQAGPSGYQKAEVDGMLSDYIAHGDAELLKQLLLENSEGPLNDYLLRLLLEKEGITNERELLRHLEEASAANDFDLEEVRWAMLEGLDHPLEVDRVHGALLGRAQGDMLDIQAQLDLRKEGIYTVEELIETLYDRLMEKSGGSEQIKEILAAYFPDYFDLIQELGKKQEQDASALGNIGWPLLLLFVALGAGLIWILIIAWRRRRKGHDTGL